LIPLDDPFDCFRWMLSWAVTIYASIVTFQSLYGWWVWLAGGDRYISMLRRYIIVQGLRLRFRTFWGDVLICGLLCVVFLLLWHAHHVLAEIARSLK
jgi:hypothetical protein